jgi:hypothetical protein
MIHVGSAEYYAHVRSRLATCDVILFEGVSSWRVGVLTLSYRLMTRRKRLGLVTQSDALRLRELQAKLIHSDVSPATFAGYWTRIPWHLRMAFLVCAPLLGAYLYLTATRPSIGKRLSIEDIPLAGDGSSLDDVPGARAAIVTRRDERLIEVLEALLARSAHPSIVGIVYGAGHMKAVTDALVAKHHFRVARSDWIRVFDYPDV